eukprot:15440510-Alexandrium_andersonii.AAC.1
MPTQRRYVAHVSCTVAMLKSSWLNASSCFGSKCGDGLGRARGRSQQAANRPCLTDSRRRCHPKCARGG